jgi:hypothetical protein
LFTKHILISLAKPNPDPTQSVVILNPVLL